jgi:ribonuclease VapC
VFVDASALVAIVTFEPEKERLELSLESSAEVSTSALTLYEAALAITRKKEISLEAALAFVDEFVHESGAVIISIDAEIGRQAILAFDRFGKGHHRAALNMGDCFSYACAKVKNLALLCKGDDFIHTDIRIA